MSIHDEAKAILRQRSTEYPDFSDEADRVCKVVNALYPHMEMTTDQYTTILICMKLARQTRRHKRDNLLDLVNYISFLDVEE